MHRCYSLIITIALLFTICLFSACISPWAPVNQTPEMPPPNISPLIDVGLVPIDMSMVPEPISFDEAKNNLKDGESFSLNPFLKKTRILFIRGGNLDESGNADQWLFGVNKGDTNELMVYDSSGWTIIFWNNTIPSEEIDLDHVVSPGALFNQNKVQIIENFPPAIPVRRDIELINGTYTITITSGSTPESLVFNATTGAAIE